MSKFKSALVSASGLVHSIHLLRYRIKFKKRKKIKNFHKVKYTLRVDQENSKPRFSFNPKNSTEIEFTDIVDVLPSKKNLKCNDQNMHSRQIFLNRYRGGWL